MLPAAIIFIALMVAALSYFKVMRAAVIRQEVVRNLTFAKINNSGTLTSPGGHLANSGGMGTDLIPAGLGGFLGRHGFVGRETPCILVRPAEAVGAYPTEMLSTFVPTTAEVSVLTYGVIYRFPTSSCP
jgi:hypothetical protein